ncbi:MBL fold metallo-hydrolase [Longispora sp. K20-0274]|uniref:MBL fold metallo-hydrolase n=1 Tax=Longispora sp. K20-0274 TaxID=3088255 RepID=UPI00399BBAB4
MLVEQLYLDCLSQASYLVADETTGRALVVDPRRDVQVYLDAAAERGLRVEGVINTHVHADFASGHLELAAATGAWIGYGRAARTEFATRALSHGDRISLGDVVVEVLETPGHTPESISLLVFAHATDTVPDAVLTGDALFIGDVGRPDLLASAGYTARDLAGMLYESVHHVLMALPDEVRVLPGHGAGSACGKNLSTQLSSTIGEQRATNYACRPMPREEFVALVTAGQPPAPAYFGHDALLNQRDHALLDTAVPALTAGEFRTVAGETVVLDVRDGTDFAAAHVAGSLNVGLDGRFAETVGAVLRPDVPVVLVAPEGRETEAVVRLARVGFDRVAGYLARPEAAFLEMADRVTRASRITAARLRELSAGSVTVLDVRAKSERDGGFIAGSLHIPLLELLARVDEVPTDRPVVVHCAGGYRSSTAASLLRAHGHPDVSDLIGGYAAYAPATACAATASTS